MANRLSPPGSQAITWVVERPALGVDGRPDPRMPVRGWKAGTPVAFTSWKDLSTRSGPHGIRGALLVASGDAAAPLAADLIRAFDGLRLKPLGQVIAPRRPGQWRVYLAQQTFTLAYGPQDYFSLSLPAETDKALPQVQDLLALAARQNPPKAGGIQAFFDGPAEVTGAVQRMLTAMAAPVQPLPLAGGVLAAWQAIPVALRTGLLALALVLALHAMSPLWQRDAGSLSVLGVVPASPQGTALPGASLPPTTAGPAQLPQTGLGQWLKALAEGLEQSPSGLPALALLEIARLEPAEGATSQDARSGASAPLFRVRLQLVGTAAAQTAGVRQLGGQTQPAVKGLVEALSGLPRLTDKPQQQADGVITMTISGGLGLVGPEAALAARQPVTAAQAATALADQAKGMGLALQISSQTAREMVFLLTDQPASQVFGWLWAQPVAPAGWALSSLRMAQGGQPGLVTVQGRIVP